MPRRRKGRALTGWLVVDKPAGMTSTAVVNKARWLLQAQKAGHAGTLDPVRWGAQTTTDDAQGEVTQSSDTRPDQAALTAALPGFTGDIQQVPPAFSAVKVEGTRAYDLARDGDRPELAARALYVESLTLVDMPDADHARLQMVCGKGGYVRAIARDLGTTLGCLGHVASLRRIWSGPFALDAALPWREDIPAEEVEAALQPLEVGLAELPECRCGALAAGPLSNGNPVEVTRTEAENGEEAWASINGEARALGTYKFGHFHPNRVFVKPEPL